MDNFLKIIGFLCVEFFCTRLFTFGTDNWILSVVGQDIIMRSELMKIGFCYDTKSDYGYSEENLEYTDFVSL